jgi:hypothetical protein
MKNKTKEEQKQIAENLLGKGKMVYPVEKTVFIEGKVPIHLIVEAGGREEALKRTEDLYFDDYLRQQSSPRTKDGILTEINLQGINPRSIDEDQFSEEKSLDDWELPQLSNHTVSSEFGWMSPSEFLRTQYIMETQNHTGEWIIDVVLANEVDAGNKVFQISFKDFGLEHPTLKHEDRALSVYFQGTKVGGAIDQSDARYGNHFELLNDYGVGSLFWNTFPEFQDYYKEGRQVGLKANGEPDNYFGVAWVMYRVRRGEIDGIQSQILPITPAECWDFWKENYTEEEE